MRFIIKSFSLVFLFTRIKTFRSKTKKKKTKEKVFFSLFRSIGHSKVTNEFVSFRFVSFLWYSIHFHRLTNINVCTHFTLIFFQCEKREKKSEEEKRRTFFIIFFSYHQFVSIFASHLVDHFNVIDRHISNTDLLLLRLFFF